MVRTGAAMAGVLLTSANLAADDKPKQANETSKAVALSVDRKAIMAAGLNEKEADCWEATAKAAGAFFELEELHPMDRQEVATAIHVIQNKLLGRPTYRAYIAAHKTMGASGDTKPEE